MHFGTSALATPAAVYNPLSGPVTGVITQYQTGISGILLQGSPTAPTAVVVNNATLPPYLNAISPTGTIYTFTRSTLAIAKDLDNATVSIYPNPTTDVLIIKGLTSSKEAASVKIFDTLGKVVLAETLNATNTVNINSLNKGTYFMEITTGETRIGKNIVKL